MADNDLASTLVGVAMIDRELDESAMRSGEYESGRRIVVQIRLMCMSVPDRLEVRDGVPAMQ